MPRLRPQLFPDSMRMQERREAVVEASLRLGAVLLGQEIPQTIRPLRRFDPSHDQILEGEFGGGWLLTERWDTSIPELVRRRVSPRRSVLVSQHTLGWAATATRERGIVVNLQAEDYTGSRTQPDLLEPQILMQRLPGPLAVEELASNDADIRWRRADDVARLVSTEAMADLLTRTVDSLRLREEFGLTPLPPEGSA